MRDKERIKLLEEKITGLEKSRFSISDIPSGEYLIKNNDVYSRIQKYSWFPFTHRDILETCPEGSIKLRFYDTSIWLKKDEFFYYSCVYTEIKKRIEEKMKEDKSK